MPLRHIPAGPAKSILDPSFRYTASFNTDLRKTFARVRRAQSGKLPRAALAEVSSMVGKVHKVR